MRKSVKIEDGDVRFIDIKVKKSDQCVLEVRNRGCGKKALYINIGEHTLVRVKGHVKLQGHVYLTNFCHKEEF